MKSETIDPNLKAVDNFHGLSFFEFRLYYSGGLVDLFCTLSKFFKKLMIMVH